MEVVESSEPVLICGGDSSQLGPWDCGEMFLLTHNLTVSRTSGSHPSRKLDVVFTEHLADVDEGHIDYVDNGAPVHYSDSMFTTSGAV